MLFGSYLNLNIIEEMKKLDFKYMFVELKTHTQVFINHVELVCHKHNIMDRKLWFVV